MYRARRSSSLGSTPIRNTIQAYEVALEKLRCDPRYLSNIDWGEPRKGHPEGSIGSHIEELEFNLAAIDEFLDSDEIAKLRLMIHIHDLMKPNVVPGGPHHGELAAQLLKEFCDDEDMVHMIREHDTFFRLWLASRPNTEVALHEDLDDLKRKIKDWNLFSTFLIIDNLTAGKDPRPLDWALHQIHKMERLAPDLLAIKAKIEEEVGMRESYLEF